MTDEVVVHERLLLNKWLAEDFGNLADLIRPLCCGAADGRPLYISHVDVAVETAAERLPASTVEIVARGYVYLVAAFYINDAIQDGHSCHDSNLSSADLVAVLPIVVLRAAEQFTKIDANTGSVFERLCGLLLVNREAMEDERKFRNLRHTDWRREYFHLWARSNAFLYLLEFVASLSGSRLSPRLIFLTQRFLALVQRGDDVCDWRRDLEEQNFSPFLRSVFQNCHTTLPEEVEEKVYLEGLMCFELRTIANEMQRVEKLFASCHGGGGLARMAQDHLVRINRKLIAIESVAKEYA